jgi:hypothetical protein
VFFDASNPGVWHDVHQLELEDSNQTLISLAFAGMGVLLFAIGAMAFIKWRRGDSFMSDRNPDPLPPEAVEVWRSMGLPISEASGPHFPAPWEKPYAEGQPNTQRKP